MNERPRMSRTLEVMRDWINEHQAEIKNPEIHEDDLAFAEERLQLAGDVIWIIEECDRRQEYIRELEAEIKRLRRLSDA